MNVEIDTALALSNLLYQLEFNEFHIKYKHILQ